MVDVNERNFRHWLPEIERAIRAAAFISIDLEFLGLPTTSHPHGVSLFDTPTERYQKLCDAVRRFPPCQLGLACFKEGHNGYEVEVFCVSLFKRLSKKVFSFSLSAMSFLSQHKFDFNKFVSEGITYSNRTEIAKLKKEIVNGDIDYDTFADGLEHRIQMLKMRLLLEARDTVDSDDSIRRQGRSPDTQIRLHHPLLLELYQKEKEHTDGVGPLGDMIDSLWDRSLTSIEAAAIIYALTEEYPNFEFQVDHTRTLLYVAERPLIFRNTVDKKRQKLLLKNLLSEISGVSQIFHCLSEKKAPLVGHNFLLDLMYIYYCFEVEFPDSYDQWKKTQHSIFPTIIDTKILATNVQEKLYAHGVTDFSLQTLGNYFDSPSCGEILPFDTPVINGGNHSRGIFDDGEHYHNAAFDALITGEVFIKLAHLYAYTKCSIPMETAWPIRKLLCVCRSRIVNRVPIPLIDTQYCYLTGEDPIGQRPDIIVVQPRRHLMWLNRITKNKKLHAWAESATYLIGNYPEFSAEDCDRIKEDLFRVLGSFRIDIKRHHGGSMHIATNTANTYARVCSFFSAHDDYWLKDETGREKKTFEQRIFSFREKKDAKDVCGLYVTGRTIGVVLAVSFSVIFGIRLVSKYHSF